MRIEPREIGGRHGSVVGCLTVLAGDERYPNMGQDWRSVALFESEERPWTGLFSKKMLGQINVSRGHGAASFPDKSTVYFIAIAKVTDMGVTALH